MTNIDPLNPFAQQMPAKELELKERMREGDMFDAAGTRRFLDAKMELDRVNWAGKIALQLRHGLLKKVTSKL